MIRLYKKIRVSIPASLRRLMLLLSCMLMPFLADAQKVLLIYDQLNNNTTALKGALEGAGFSVTLSDVPGSAWDNTNPSLNGFKCVVHLNRAGSSAIPSAGQQALTNFVKAGGGYVSDASSAYKHNLYGGSGEMADLMLFRGGIVGTGGANLINYAKIEAMKNHPLLANLPDPLLIYTGFSDVGGAANLSDVQALMNSGSNPAVLIRNFVKGKVVNFGLIAEPTWDVFENTEIQKLYVSSVQWASSLNVPGNALSFVRNNLNKVSINSTKFPAYDNINNKNSSYTIEAWVNPANLSIPNVDQVIVSWGTNSREEGNFLKLRYFNNQYYLINSWFSNDITVVLPNDIAGRWSHIAVTYDATADMRRVYLNGALIDLGGTGNAPHKVTSTNITIGGNALDNNSYFDGKIDELRIFNTVRTPTEIVSDSKNEISTATAGLVAYYNFDQGIASGLNPGEDKLRDLTGNYNYGTLNNFGLSGTVSNWVGSYAMVVPTATAASSIKNNSFVANWTAPVIGTADSYRLDVATDADFTNLVPGYSNLTVNSGTLLKVNNLNAATTYYYRVSAYSNDLQQLSARSNSIEVTTTALAAPGNALNFNSSANNYVNLNGLPVGLNNANFTIETWIKTTGVSTGIFTSGNNNSAWELGEKCFYLDNEGRPTLVGHTKGYIKSTKKVNDNKWHHIAVTVIQGNPMIRKIYVDGVECTDPSTDFYGNQADFGSGYLGRGNYNPDEAPNFFNGSLDQFRLWNVARTAAQIVDGMEKEKPADVTGLKAYYNFDQGEANLNNTGVVTLYNQAGSNFNGTLSNFNLSGSNSNWVGSYALVTPVATAANSIQRDAFAANWTAPSIGTADKYFLDVATDANFTNFVEGFQNLEVVGATSQNVSGLSPVTNYYYRVRAYGTDAAAQGLNSNVIQATTIKADQNLIFPATATAVYGAADFEAGAASDNSSIAITYTSSNPSVATVTASGTVHILKVGTTTITASQASSTIYNATDKSQVLTITPKVLTVTAIANNKVYDGRTPAVVTFTSDKINGDAITISKTAADFDNANVGIGKTVTVSGIAIAGTGAGNYTLSSVTASTTADITPKQVSITAFPNFKTYGNADPSFTYISLTPLMGSDRLSGSLSREPGEQVGAYKITLGTLQVSPNYELKLNNVNLTISKRLLTITVTPQNKVYDGNTTADIVFTRNSLAGDDVTVTKTASNFSDKNVGTGKLVTVTGIGITGADAGNYTLVPFIGILRANITAKPITVTADAQVKTYGDADPILTYQLSDPLASGDSFTGALNRNPGEQAGVYAINQNTLKLNSNYSLTYTGANLTIEKKAITIAATASDKVYDGNTTASVSLSGVFVAGDDISIDKTGANFSDKNVGVGKTVTVSGISISGTNSSNYTINTTATTTASITPMALTVTAIANNKVYDGRTAAVVTLSVNKIGADVVTVSKTAADFDNANVGIGKTVTVSGIRIAGAGASNYTVVSTVQTTADITPKQVSITAFPSFKTYGNADPSFTYISLTPLVGSDRLSGSLSREPGEQVGTYKITLGTLQVSPNYELKLNNVNLTISKRLLTITVTPQNKVYDGNTTADIVFTRNSLAGDDVTVTKTASNFSDKNVGTGKLVTVTGIGITGADAGNYTLIPFIGILRANITAKPITVTADAQVKTYGDADPILTYQLSDPLVSGDSFTGALNRNPGEQAGVYAINQNTLKLNSNYSLTYTGANLTIEKKAITIAATASDKVYDGNTTASVSLSGVFVAGDDISIDKTGANFSDKNVGVGKTVTVSGISISGTNSSNYTINTTATTTASITPMALTVTAIANNKVYDGRTAAVVTLSVNKIGADVVTVSKTAADFDNANVGIGKTVTVSGIAIAGTGAGNYTLSSVTASTTADITPKQVNITAIPNLKTYGDADPSLRYISLTPLVGSDRLSGSLSREPGEQVGTYKITLGTLQISPNYELKLSSANFTIIQKLLTVTAKASDKVYDGNTTADVILTGNIISGDDIVITKTAANFIDKNVGTGKLVTVTGINISGTAARNYLLLPITATTASITVKQITVTADAQAKTYGDADPAVLTYKQSASLAQGDAFTGALNRNPGESVGTYVINQNTLKLSTNYKLIYEADNLVINKKVLTITIDNKSKLQGTANPALTLSYSGFIPGEDKSVLLTAPLLSTTATLTSLPGVYPITAGSTATATNYSIVYSGGQLTVNAAVITDVVLATVPLYENSPANTTAGTLSTLSNDPASTFNYTLVSGTGSADNAKFNIQGNTLRTSAPLDFETQAVYSVRVKATSQYGVSFERVFSISLLDVNESPTLDPINNQSICYVSATQTIALSNITPGPEKSQLTTITVSSNNPALFDLLNVNKNGTTGTLSYRAKAGASGIATVTVTVKDDGGTANGGVDTYSRTFTITIFALPTVTITSDKGTDVSKGETIKLTATGGVSYVWKADNSILSGQTTAILTVRPSVNTTYTVTVTNANGCTETQSFTINVASDYAKVKVTNLLTPNGDGYNDKWIVENIDLYPNNEVKVFDKAGRIVYAKKGYDNSWEGTYNGVALKEDTYYYIIDFGSGFGVLKGFITIVRE